MTIDDIINELNSEDSKNEALSFLYNLLLNTNEKLSTKLTELISYPDKIADTNKFASLLVEIGSESFIEPLIYIISNTTNSKTWVADYMYALGSILIDREGFWPVNQDVVDFFGKWLLSSDGGEISWKAGIILSNLKHPNVYQYLKQGAYDTNLFHLTRIDCIRGIVNQYHSKAEIILQELTADTNQNVRNAVADAQLWIKNNDSKQNS